MKKALIIAVFAVVMGPFSIAAAYGPTDDITSQISVSQTGVVTLSSDLLSQPGLSQILGWYPSGTNPYGGTCFLKTSGFSTPFSVVGCSSPNVTYRYVVGSNLGYFIISVDSDGNFYSGSGINWAQITVAPPLDFNAVKFVATSTSFFSGDASGTLQELADQCATTGNIFSNAICRAFAYLFVPNPTVTDQFRTLGPDLAGRFPVSWFYEVQTEVGTFATTSTAGPVWTMNLHDIGIGSTSPMGNFLPNMVVFSSSTVKHYITDAQWDALMTLAAAAFWLAGFYTLYAIGHALFTSKHKAV